MKLKTEKIHKTNSLFFEQINNISRPLKRIRTHTHTQERTQIINIRNERGGITTESMGIKRIIK